MYITGNMFDGRGDGVPGCERGVHNDTKVFDLEVRLIQGFERTSIIEVVVERYDEVRICDGGDKSGVFSRGQE